MNAYVLDRHEEAIKEYFGTGLTRSDWYTLYSDQTFTVPPRKISVEDVKKYYTINVHLGRGMEGVRRLNALRMLASEAGYFWNNEPSIGRWLSAVADERLGSDRRPKSRVSDLKNKIQALAREQLKMWQALIKELD